MGLNVTRELPPAHDKVKLIHLYEEKILMKDQYIQDYMTTHPMIIHEDATLPDAHAMMKEHHVRRLPVVDADGKLVGIISQTDVREAEPSDATTLSIYELNYLLAKLTVKKIMSKNIITLKPTSTIAEAAKIMLEKKIGGIPIVDDNHKVVGILTESDIFRLVVNLYAE